MAKKRCDASIIVIQTFASSESGFNENGIYLCDHPEKLTLQHYATKHYTHLKYV